METNPKNEFEFNPLSTVRLQQASHLVTFDLESQFKRHNRTWSTDSTTSAPSSSSTPLQAEQTQATCQPLSTEQNAIAVKTNQRTPPEARRQLSESQKDDNSASRPWPEVGAWNDSSKKIRKSPRAQHTAPKTPRDSFHHQTQSSHMIGSPQPDHHPSFEFDCYMPPQFSKEIYEKNLHTLLQMPVNSFSSAAPVHHQQQKPLYSHHQQPLHHHYQQPLHPQHQQPLYHQHQHPLHHQHQQPPQLQAMQENMSQTFGNHQQPVVPQFFQAPQFLQAQGPIPAPHPIHTPYFHQASQPVQAPQPLHHHYQQPLHHQHQQPLQLQAMQQNMSQSFANSQPVQAQQLLQAPQNVPEAPQPAAHQQTQGLSPDQLVNSQRMAMLNATGSALNHKQLEAQFLLQSKSASGTSVEVEPSEFRHRPNEYPTPSTTPSETASGVISTQLENAVSAPPESPQAVPERRAQTTLELTEAHSTVVGGQSDTFLPSTGMSSSTANKVNAVKREVLLKKPSANKPSGNGEKKHNFHKIESFFPTTSETAASESSIEVLAEKIGTLELTAELEKLPFSVPKFGTSQKKNGKSNKKTPLSDASQEKGIEVQTVELFTDRLLRELAPTTSSSDQVPEEESGPKLTKGQKKNLRQKYKRSMEKAEEDEPLEEETAPTMSKSQKKKMKKKIRELKKILQFPVTTPKTYEEHRQDHNNLSEEAWKHFLALILHNYFELMERLSLLALSPRMVETPLMSMDSSGVTKKIFEFCSKRPLMKWDCPENITRIRSFLLNKIQFYESTEDPSHKELKDFFEAVRDSTSETILQDVLWMISEPVQDSETIQRDKSYMELTKERVPTADTVALIVESLSVDYVRNNIITDLTDDHLETFVTYIRTQLLCRRGVLSFDNLSKDEMKLFELAITIPTEEKSFQPEKEPWSPDNSKRFFFKMLEDLKKKNRTDQNHLFSSMYMLLLNCQSYIIDTDVFNVSERMYMSPEETHKFLFRVLLEPKLQVD